MEKGVVGEPLLGAIEERVLQLYQIDTTLAKDLLRLLEEA
jgi:hypothetical protein